MRADLKQRRRRLAQNLVQKNAKGVALGSFQEGFDANLFYLTGLREKAVLVLAQDAETLYLPERSPREITFDGAGPDRAELARCTGIDSIVHISETDLAKLQIPRADETVKRRLAELRWVKDEFERAQMREAARISRHAHDLAHALLREGLSEWELRVEFERALFLNGCRETAYTTIAAANEHANTLHYIDARGTLLSGGVVLLDGGGKFEGYAADITSTWIVGEASEEQARVFEIVRRAQTAAIEMVKPGVTMNALQTRTEEVLYEGLKAAGIVRKQAELKELFPHRVSHWIGLDVHDPKMSAQDGDRELVEGVTLTIEPGLYFHERASRDYGRYRGIGARFEEDVLVNRKGYEVLSRPKTA
ncbi:MAG: aminopeptidase P N-terminal domain-containing protein [Bdellovibrionaceae bacterium]|nr:aminopeptidase P N-terminal domain-containing protein [Pseudobdellovibrionaceae bacterium]